MRKYIIFILSIYSSLYCMEKSNVNDIILIPPIWNAEEYDKGNTLQTNAFLHFINKNKIIVQNCNILDAGCGTGKIAAKLAETAKFIHGFDACNDMITRARQNYKHISNVSFEQCFAEKFKSDKKYQLAIMSSCFHWFQNKEMALQRVHESLDKNGELFADILTNDCPTPLNLIVFLLMSNDNVTMQEHFLKYPVNTFGSSYPSLDELKATLNKTGFDILKTELQSFDSIMTESEFRQLQFPIVKSRPGFNDLSNEKFNAMFEDFINRCLTKLKKTDDGKYNYPFTTRIIHARKKTNNH